MGTLSKDYVDRLIALMHVDGYPTMIEAIGCIGPVHENVVPNIMDWLEKKGRDWRHSPKSKMAAWVALTKFGEKSAPVVPLLARYLRGGVAREEPPELYIQWFKLVRAIGPKAKETLPSVQKWVNAKKLPRGWAKEKLEEVRKEAALTVEKLK
jgi:hypothetical protein